MDLLIARGGRGLARLVQGLTEGDPVAWTITIGVVVIFGGIGIYKHYNGDS
jgi:hypothetical protein